MQGSDWQIDYERLVSEAMRDAMRNVLRSVLTDVAKAGLPGEHHFYISFSTVAPGVSLSKRLMEKYPEEMTIVLQHRFWDLVVHGDRFEVKLQFNSIPEKLVVPFEAIRVFVDPSVRFGHQFDDGEAEAADGDAVSPAVRGAARGGSARTPAAGARNTDKRRTSAARKKTDRDGELSDPALSAPASSEPTATGGPSSSGASVDRSLMDRARADRSSTDRSPVDKSPAEPATEPVAEPSTAPANAPAPANEPAKVISLDKFRKK